MSYYGYFAKFRWTKTNPLGNKELLVVPVHENLVHWCLMAIHVPSRSIYYLDRCEFTAVGCHGAIQQYFPVPPV